MAELSHMFAALPKAHKRVIAVLVIAGGISVGTKIRSAVIDAQRQQKQLAADAHAGRTNTRKQQKISVNKQFAKRLQKILSICIPSPVSREARLVLLQGALLVSRTLLTEWISRIEGWSGSTLVTLKFAEFLRSVLAFAMVGIPAAIVNSALKYMQKQIELAFQSRLTEFLHKQYCSNRAYYAAATLGGMMNPDQRITEDVEKFCFAISDLYAHTLKPLLDVILFTRSLANTMGYKGQFGLYVYYVGVAWMLRTMSPPLAQMTAQEAALSGGFRAAHQRLVTNSEEVAFNDPPAGVAEQQILNQHLRRLLQYSRLSAFQRFVQQISDGYFVKYFASVVALLVYGAPLYFQDPSQRLSQEELTQDYIRSMRLLQNTSRGVGDLILVYKRVSNLASHTSRVAELLEQVSALSAEDAEHRELFRRNVSVTHMLGVSRASGSDMLEPPPSPVRRSGPTIAFYRVALDSPDGAPLFRELTFEVVPGNSVMLMGPNGCGKSSLFRVLAGLWPLQAGEITTPHKTKLFYLAQRPYLVTGTLRDQLLYPFPPRAVWLAATVKERAAFCEAAGREPPAEISPELDASLRAALAAVDLEYLALRGTGFDQVQSWQETLSGGEKQRLAMARLLWHKPQYAVLDECTSAVSADGELKLYQSCQKAGITFLSIAHRPALKRFHSLVIHFDANVAKTGQGWWAESLTPSSALSTGSSGMLAPSWPGGQLTDHHTNGSAAAASPTSPTHIAGVAAGAGGSDAAASASPPAAGECL
ncbi:ABC transporter transmembrane region 2-domain-containing protein [Haematococcus lacustris]